MTKNNQVKIGNENFKIWLKRLDPVARVEKMSAIAKTQASAGLKGSLIKASLAQISQRCQVMLIRLTDEDINTRKRSVKKNQDLENKPIAKPIEVDIHKKQSPSAGLHDSKTKSLDSSISNRDTKFSKITPSVSKKPNPNEDLKDSGCRPSLKRPRNDRLEERYKELFGDFYDDIGVVNNNTSKLIKLHKSKCDRKVNKVLSTTVNVNIYNSSPSNEGENTLVNRTHSEKCIEGSSETCNNRLRIDVSLSNDGSNVVEAQTLSKKKAKSKKCVMSYKSRKRKRVYNQSKYHQLAEKNKIDQIKSDMLVLSGLHNDNSEDDPVQELWKIFGMESPTDRSENIIKSHPQTSNSKDIAKNKVNILNVLPNNNQEVHTNLTAISKPSSVSNIDTYITKIVSMDVGVNSEGTENNNLNSVDNEPVCKIEGTFSLAKLISGSLYDKGLKSQSLTNGHENIENTKDLSTPSEVRQFKNNVSGQLIEIISLSDDEEDLTIASSSNKDKGLISNKDKGIISQNIDSNKCKVGTIRVKNFGLLMDQQKVQETSETEINHSPLQNCHEPISSNQVSGEQDVKEIFFETYKLYFDELLESKILKLGELLHLAISDEVRRKERIKRAEQLSSTDLIYKEKHRADNDFNEIMKVRGNEFAPLINVILNGFSPCSKVTLFLALFIRIFKRATEIDIQNSNHVLDAKKVVCTILHKTLSDHKDIFDALYQKNEGDFLKQLQKLTALIKAFHNKYSTQDINSSKDVVLLNEFSPNHSMMTKNKSQDTVTSNGIFNISNANSETVNIETHSTNVKAATPSAVQSENSADHGTFQGNSMQRLARDRIAIPVLTDALHAKSLLKKRIPNPSGYDKTLYNLSPQSQKTTNKTKTPQTSSSPVSVSNLLLGQLNSTIKFPGNYAGTINLPNPPSQNHNLSTASSQNRNNSVSQSELSESVNQVNIHYLSHQKAGSARKLTNQEQLHSVNILEARNYTHLQKNDKVITTPNDNNSSSKMVLGSSPNTLLTPGHVNQRPEGKTIAADSIKKKSSASSLNIACSRKPAVCDVSAKSSQSVHTYPSNSPVENKHSNYLSCNSAQIHSTSKFNPYNTANTTISTPNLNEMTTIPTIENQLQVIKTSDALIPIHKDNRGIFPNFNLSLSKPNESPPTTTNLSSQGKNPTSIPNQYSLTSTSTSSLSNPVVMITTENGKQYNVKPGALNFSPAPVNSLIQLRANPYSTSLGITPCSSNLYVNSQPINHTGIGHKYNSNIRPTPTPKVNPLLRGILGGMKTYRRKNPGGFVNVSSAKTDLQEQDSISSTNSTVTDQITANSGTDTIDASRLSNLQWPSKNRTTSETPQILSHVTPNTIAPSIYPESVIEPVLSVPRLITVNSFANQHEHIRPTSTNYMPEYPVTSSVASSPPREPSSSAVQPIISDLTQPTVTSGQKAKA